MATRMSKGAESKAQSLLQVEPQRSALAPSPTPSQPVSQPATRPISQLTTSPPTSTDSDGSPLPSLQERLWNEAYDGLKASEPKLVEAYEKILSARLHRNDLSSVACEPTENEIGRSRETRCRQMRQLVREGLDQAQKQASIKQGIDEGLQAVQAVRGIVDKAVYAVPETAVAWVGVCLRLEILLNPVTKSYDNRKGIAYVLSRMEWYWHLVSLLLDKNKAEQSSARLQAQLEKHIVQLYEKLLSYQIKSVCFYCRDWLAVIGRDILKLDDWDGQLKEIQDAETAVQNDSDQYNTKEVRSALRKLVVATQTLMKALHDIHSAIQDVRSAILDQTQQQDQKHQDGRDKQCLKDLRETDPRDEKTRIEATKGSLLKDSYRWILDNDDFRRWRNDPQSQLLWIKGSPGKGKTMLLCGIIDELEKEPDNCLSYFFCQGTEARFSHATAVLRGLIYLLVIQQPSLISHIREKHDHAVLIIDALDECNTNRHQLLDFITKPSRIKWIVSSRNWLDIEEKLDKAEHKVRLSLELNNDSISKAVDTYIRFKVDQLAHVKAYDWETRRAVESHLTTHAESSFLWVALVCKALSDIKQARHTLSKLKSFPPGLGPLYDRMIEHICDLEDAGLCKEVLAIVSEVGRPVTLDELKVRAESLKNFDLLDLEDLIGYCSFFLTLREGVVDFVHQSARDFLLLTRIKDTVRGICDRTISDDEESLHSTSLPSMFSRQISRSISQTSHTMSSGGRVHTKPDECTLSSTSLSISDTRRDDDIESLISNGLDIASDISTGRSHMELNAIYELADYFAQIEELIPLYKSTLKRMSQERFANNYRRILKSYYLELWKEACDEKEKMAARVLRKRTNRATLARKIVEVMQGTDETEEGMRLRHLDEARLRRRHLNDWLSKLPLGGESGEDLNTEEQAYDSEDEEENDDDDSDDEDESSDEELGFPEINQIEKFLRRGKAFQTLLIEFRLLRLPGSIREIINTIPKGSIAINSENDTSVLNRAKSFLEDYTGYYWDWWPFKPPVRDVRQGNWRVEWKMYGHCLQEEVSKEVATLLADILDLVNDHPPRCHCCSMCPSPIPQPLSAKGAVAALKQGLAYSEHLLQTTSDALSTAAQRYTPSSTPSTNGSNAAGPTHPIAVNANAQGGGATQISKTPSTHTRSQSAKPYKTGALRVLFAVQGWRWSLELEGFCVPNGPCDSSFFRTLRKFQQIHRGALLHWASPFRFLNCRFVRFERMCVNRVISSSKHELPDFHGYTSHYEYEPRPPTAKLPLIHPEAFRILLNECDERCFWRVLPWHDCIRLSPRSSYLSKIPKKKQDFLISDETGDSVAFGIEADYMLSLRLLAIYHLVPILASFIFWACFLEKHPDDWQNASVPLLTVVGLITVFWITIGQRVGFS